MNNFYITNHFAHIFTTFLRSNGFHDYCISEYMGKHFQKINSFKKRAIRVASPKSIVL